MYLRKMSAIGLEGGTCQQGLDAGSAVCGAPLVRVLGHSDYQ